MSDTILYQSDSADLDGMPWVDVAGNVRAALFAGERFTAMTREVLALRRGVGGLFWLEAPILPAGFFEPDDMSRLSMTTLLCPPNEIRAEALFHQQLHSHCL